MIKESNPMRWMGKQMGEITDLVEVEEKAEEHLDTLLNELYEANEKRRELDRLRELQEEERCTKSFFNKLKGGHRKEEIFALTEEQIDEETEEKKEVEYSRLEDLQRIATNFYKELWKKKNSE